MDNEKHQHECDCDRPRWHESVFSIEAVMVIIFAGIAIAGIVSAVRS